MRNNPLIYKGFCEIMALMYQSMEEFKASLPKKPKLGLYIDDSNLYKRGKATGWLTDYKKLYKWASELNTIVYARVYIGNPRHEPAKSMGLAFQEYLKKVGFSITSKDLKKIKSTGANKCNFDIEMHDEIIVDLDDIDMVYLCSGDSDFLRTKERILKAQKHLKFIAYNKNCAWELKQGSWFISLDSIKDEVERTNKKK